MTTIIMLNNNNNNNSDFYINLNNYNLNLAVCFLMDLI